MISSLQDITKLFNLRRVWNEKLEERERIKKEKSEQMIKGMNRKVMELVLMKMSDEEYEKFVSLPVEDKFEFFKQYLGS